MESRLFLKICMLACFGCMLTEGGEDTAKEILEHILQTPNSDKILNSVLGRIERSRQERLAAMRAAEDEDCDYTSEALPEYTEALRESREIGPRQIGAQKHYPICHMERKIRRLNTNEYEYRPAYYEEITCIPSVQAGATNEICSSLGFSCIQWNKTIHLTRRRYTSLDICQDKVKMKCLPYMFDVSRLLGNEDYAYTGRVRMYVAGTQARRNEIAYIIEAYRTNIDRMPNWKTGADTGVWQTGFVFNIVCGIFYLLY